MSYIGNKPALNYTTFAVQHFTTSATTGYTLDQAVTNENDIRLVINNVVQQPGSSYAYTASGTTLTLSAATAGTDTMYCVFLGKAVQTVNPGAGSVGTSQLADNAVTNAKLADATQGDILYYGASGAPAQLSAGTSGYVLQTRGAGANPVWAVDAAGTVTGYTNGVDNRVITSSGTTTLNGETNFIYNGTIAGLGPDGANADLGVGLHVKTADSGASVDANSDELVLENSGHTGMTILSGTANTGYIVWGDSGNNAIGRILYNHASNYMRFDTNATERLRIAQYDFCVGTTSPISTNGITFKAGTTAGDDWISSYRTTASTPHYIHAFYSDAGGTQTAKYAVYADGTASAISDVNYKKNITNARNYLEDLEKIDVIKYNLKTDNEDEFKKLGFSAQQVETIFPHMIDADNTPLKEFYEEGDEIPEGKVIGDIKKTTPREVKLLKKEIFIPMLVTAVQELSAKIKTLETENTDIKARLTALENA